MNEVSDNNNIDPQLTVLAWNFYDKYRTNNFIYHKERALYIITSLNIITEFCYDNVHIPWYRCCSEIIGRIRRSEFMTAQLSMIEYFDYNEIFNK